MKQKCAQQVGAAAAAAGRAVTDAQLRDIESRLDATMRRLARTEDGWAGMPRDQRVSMAAEAAMADIKAEAARKEPAQAAFDGMAIRPLTAGMLLHAVETARSTDAVPQPAEPVDTGNVDGHQEVDVGADILRADQEPAAGQRLQRLRQRGRRGEADLDVLADPVEHLGHGQTRADGVGVGEHMTDDEHGPRRREHLDGTVGIHTPAGVGPRVDRRHGFLGVGPHLHPSEHGTGPHRRVLNPPWVSRLLAVQAIWLQDSAP